MKCEWFESTKPLELTPKVLEKHGVLYDNVPLKKDAIEQAIENLKHYQGYTNHDVVEITPDHPDLEKLKTMFKNEHSHTEDEVRLILEGEGIFDIRDSRNGLDDWMRVHVEAGDLLVVPAGRYHRFFLTEKNHVKAVRVFRDPAGWVADYRIKL